MRVSEATLKRHKITRVQFDKLVALQEERCGGCDKDLNLDPDGVAVDHDHATSKVRGLLCRDCNTLIGRLGDSHEVARKRWLQIERYLLGRQQYTDALISGVAGQIETETEADRLVSEAPTWTSAFAIRLGFAITSQDIA